MISNDNFKAIAELDLDAIKVKLMHQESGEGWSLEKANMVEFEYRRFLILMKSYPTEETAPLFDVDTFWHYHILDTLKYAKDCEEIFGYFLHHFPYVGLRGEADEEAHHRVGERMKELYEQTFGEDYIRATPQTDVAGAPLTAFSSAPSVAFSSRAPADADVSAKTAFSSRAPVDVSAKTAFSSRAPADASMKTAFSSAAVQKTAFSSAATKVAFSSRAPAAADTTMKTAFSSAAVKTAFSSAATKTAFSSRAPSVAFSSRAPAQASATAFSSAAVQSADASANTAFSSAPATKPEASQASRFYSDRPSLNAQK